MRPVPTAPNQIRAKCTVRNRNAAGLGARQSERVSAGLFSLRYIRLEYEYTATRRRGGTGRACGRSNRQANMKGIPEGVFGGDNRAVAPVLGVILLFGIAAIGVSVWQSTVIPSQNADTEFNHYAEVQGDMGDLRQAHLETAASGEPKAPTLKLGVAYTTRIIGVNPPDPSGTVRDENIGSFSLENAPAKTSDSRLYEGSYRSRSVWGGTPQRSMADTSSFDVLAGAFSRLKLPMLSSRIVPLGSGGFTPIIRVV